MLSNITRPYLIVPHLVRQSTWGGSYIASYKNIQDNEIRSWKIGQSYELYGKSVLSLASDTSDRHFLEDVVWYNKNRELSPTSEVLSLEDFINKDARRVLGPAVKTQTMPLLLKFTQALGNSFQLHIKKSVQDTKWKPKPESWYYLEDGILTFGIKKGADLGAYRQVCLRIEKKMQELSDKIKGRKLSYDHALREAREYIEENNPWVFVNTHRVKKGSIIDLSPGGIHHSWEEDAEKYPLGNIVFEIQADVTDEDSTIRSFDKGKIQKNGDVRPIQIDDYFTHLDTDPLHNDLSLATRKRSGEALLSTPYYSLDLLTVSKEIEYETASSFVHLFVVQGGVEVESANHTITIDRGYSCLIPHATKIYSLQPTEPNTSVLRSYIA